MIQNYTTVLKQEKRTDDYLSPSACSSPSILPILFTYTLECIQEVLAYEK